MTSVISSGTSISESETLPSGLDEFDAILFIRHALFESFHLKFFKDSLFHVSLQAGGHHVSFNLPKEHLTALMILQEY